MLFADRLDDALTAPRKSVELKPCSPLARLPLVVACVEARELEDAKAHGRFVLEQTPGLTADDNAFVDLIAEPADRARVVAALRRAGLR